MGNTEIGDSFAAVEQIKRQVRQRHGHQCPVCQIKQPNRAPSILLPGQRCKVDWHIDVRPPRDWYDLAVEDGLIVPRDPREVARG